MRNSRRHHSWCIYRFCSVPRDLQPGFAAQPVPIRWILTSRFECQLRPLLPVTSMLASWHVSLPFQSTLLSSHTRQALLHSFTSQARRNLFQSSLAHDGILLQWICPQKAPISNSQLQPQPHRSRTGKEKQIADIARQAQRNRISPFKTLSPSPPTFPNALICALAVHM